MFPYDIIISKSFPAKFAPMYTMVNELVPFDSRLKLNKVNTLISGELTLGSDLSANKMGLDVEHARLARI